MFNQLDTIVGDISDVHDTAQYPLGAIIIDAPMASGKPTGAQDTGARQWIYVEANAALAAGQVCKKDPSGGNPKYQVIPVPGASGATSSSFVAVGVAQHAIADGKFGFIQQRGRGQVLASASAGCTADTPLRTSTVSGEDGQVIDAAATGVSIGVSVGGASAATGGTLVFCNLALLGA